MVLEIFHSGSINLIKKSFNWRDNSFPDIWEKNNHQFQRKLAGRGRRVRKNYKKWGETKYL